MTTTLLPQAFWFRLAIPCRCVDAPSKSPGKGRLIDLPSSCALPRISELDDKPAWADVRVAWNPAGLAITVEASGTSGADQLPEQADAMTGLQVWVDTRDTRDVSRATRFCHRFVARLVPTGARTAPRVDVAQRTIARAVADAPLCSPDCVTARAERIRRGWRLELMLTAAALNGFDPDTNRRLGFAYQISDPAHENQYLGVGREFPIGENPSLWSTLVLSDEA